MITVYQDRRFSFIIKTPPAAVLLKKGAGIAKCSAVPNSVNVASVSRAQVEEVAKLKMPDLNANSLDQATNIILGTARSMGITVKD